LLRFFRLVILGHAGIRLRLGTCRAEFCAASSSKYSKYSKYLKSDNNCVVNCDYLCLNGENVDDLRGDVRGDKCEVRSEYSNAKTGKLSLYLLHNDLYLYLNGENIGFDVLLGVLRGDSPKVDILLLSFFSA
jgi:hypothetical protein